MCQVYKSTKTQTMESTEKKLTHDESLHIIHSMIATAQNKINEDGFHFLLWGGLVIIASLLNYYFVAVSPNEKGFLVWMLMPFVGGPIAGIYEWRKKKTEKVVSHSEASYGFLWMGFGVTIFCVIYFSVMNGISPMPFILALVGLATFVSGRMFRFAALTIGGIVFWICSFIAAYSQPEIQLLINAGATFIGYIIPGILLWRNYKAGQNV